MADGGRMTFGKRRPFPEKGGTCLRSGDLGAHCGVNIYTRTEWCGMATNVWFSLEPHDKFSGAHKICRWVPVFPPEGHHHSWFRENQTAEAAIPNNPSMRSRFGMQNPSHGSQWEVGWFSRSRIINLNSRIMLSNCTLWSELATTKCWTCGAMISYAGCPQQCDSCFV